jgi:hypothetical protein
VKSEPWTNVNTISGVRTLQIVLRAERIVLLDPPQLVPGLRRSEGAADRTCQSRATLSYRLTLGDQVQGLDAATPATSQTA